MFGEDEAGRGIDQIHLTNTQAQIAVAVMLRCSESFTSSSFLIIHPSVEVHFFETWSAALSIPLKPIAPSYVRDYQPEEMTQQYGGRLRELAIVNFAYRPAQPSATGGPNGVLRVKQELLGSSYRGIPLYYFYEPRGLVLPPMWQTWAKAQNIKTMGRNILSSHNFIQNMLGNFIPNVYSTHGGTGFHFFCHDIGTAASAHMCGFNYTLMYHNQGSFINERTSFGEEINEAERYLYNHFEKIAFENADRVYFPSLGASEAFFSTTEVVDRSMVNLAPAPLYNTVTDFEVADSAVPRFLAENGLERLLDRSVRAQYTVYISVGDYTQNKGIDRGPAVLGKIAESSKKKVLWIVLGNKHNSGIYESLVENAPTFGFETCFVPTRIPHAEAMGLIHWADWLFMMQRHAIFDFSTLETMKIARGVILSPVGGNLEFNRGNNIVYIDPDNFSREQAQAVAAADSRAAGVMNSTVFEEHFAAGSFRQAYRAAYDHIIENSLSSEVLRVLPDKENGDPVSPLLASEIAKEIGRAKPSPPPPVAMHHGGLLGRLGRVFRA